MNIPSISRCYRFFDEMEMMTHIVAHSEQVCRVAVCLADHLTARGIPLNVDLIRASAMLHDITKTRSFRTKEDHAKSGAAYLTAKGYPEVGQIVAQHVVLDRYFPFPDPDEAEIVNYADKRVLHDKITPLAERMGYIFEKYGTSADQKSRIRMLWSRTESLETRLFKNLPFEPGQLKREVETNGERG